jgi:hypothetical protein
MDIPIKSVYNNYKQKMINLDDSHVFPVSTDFMPIVQPVQPEQYVPLKQRQLKKSELDHIFRHHDIEYTKNINDLQKVCTNIEINLNGVDCVFNSRTDLFYELLFLVVLENSKLKIQEDYIVKMRELIQELTDKMKSFEGRERCTRSLSKRIRFNTNKYLCQICIYRKRIENIEQIISGKFKFSATIRMFWYAEMFRYYDTKKTYEYPNLLSLKELNQICPTPMYSLLSEVCLEENGYSLI